MIEIERKFLVNSNRYREQASSKSVIIQGYLNSDPLRTVRVRLRDQIGFLTVKGKSCDSGLSRFEWEKEISLVEAKALLQLCEKSVVSKTRFEISIGEHLFEVDEFSGPNEGLVIAEIELSSENEEFSNPDWLGREVTGEKKYYNSNLSKRPFGSWE
jgi:CYTH domain-containing protein|tara:strand:- start:543 stop:1013 length:471 start_codon:yes stop_codon:yes gene_type:complete